ncbi:DUF3108 domain-containing protein [Methylophilus aquaticus]|uniref:DUF3108 domain-containing protein n=1 Tax=Methylophilus aquaticus TaxID=1971610 RepID=A0ABT9JPK7_9PROT|nr:DUF3108 domain-containing protein [Methylophilus aquaticus]MDP8566506.1 DUF3108 domain-containing protein [Methylophilus aquaticus]
MISNHGLLKWIKARVTWQLGLGLLLSLMLHLCVLSQSGWISLFSGEDDVPSVLQARLVIPPPPPVASTPAPPPAPAVKKASPGPDALPDTAVDVAQQPLPALPEAPVSDTVQPETETEMQAEDETRVAELEQAVDAAEQPAPYQQVSTHYEVFVNGETSAAGTASIEYAVTPDQQYTLAWTVEGRGLLKLLYPKLVQESRGAVGPRGLKPAYYRYAFGSRADKSYEASFDWETRLLTLKTGKGEQSHDLPANTLDILSFMYQFMFVPPLQEMHVALTNGKRLGEYDYAFEGEESLQLGEQTVQTLHIAHSRGDTDEKIELWLASEYRYVPVKIRKVEKNGMVIEQVATQIQAR